MNPTLEELTKAADTSTLLARDVRAAHSLACRDGHELLAMVLESLIGETVSIQRRLDLIHDAFQRECEP